MRRFALAATLLPLSACAAIPAAAPEASPPPMQNVHGLERVIGHSAAQLTQLFGKPDLDLREMGARKLQFRGPICVLDAYLDPPARGREPVATWVDARQRDGSDIDKASCVAALSRRGGGG